MIALIAMVFAVGYNDVSASESDGTNTEAELSAARAVGGEVV